MHYYQFNIGDYASHTQGLSLLEDIAYRRLIDQYYLSEKPPKGDCLEVSRSIGMREHSVEVCYVLEKFFVSKKNAWFHSRVEREIFEYKKGQKNKSKAGKASAEARKQKAIENTQENDQQVLSSVEQSLNNCATNHKPITNNHKPVIKPAKQSKKITLGKYLEQCKESGVKAIPDNHVLFDYMEKQGLPEEFVFICWRRFVDYYRHGSGSKKLYIDWPTTFLNNIKNNYYKLWYLDDQNNYVLTTAGKQAQKEFADHE
jgi:uncharacterized protein YdaU (DUF1376 family)